MPEAAETIDIDGNKIDIVLSDHVLRYLADPHTPAKTIARDVLVAKAVEAVSQAHDIYKTVESAFTGAVSSASTKLNFIFAYRRIKLRHHEFKIVTIEVKKDFGPRDRKDHLIKVSKKTRSFKDRRAFEIGPDIFALDTSFENGDPLGLIQAHLVQDLVARRKEFAPGFCGTFDTADGSIYCVATVGRSGTIFIDSALWQPYSDIPLLEVR